MPDLAAFQDSFAAGLLTGAPPADLARATPDANWRDRYAVYQNNVVTALADAVVRTHPTVEKLVGAEFLRGAAVAFVRACPPGARDLTLAGEGFADFLRSFPPAEGLAYLPDVAALDRAWLAALFAEDARPLAPADLAELAGEDVMALAPGLAPSARIVASDLPAYSIWAANREGDGRVAVRPESGGEIALVWKSPGSTRSLVRHRKLEPDEAAFICALADGASLGDAAAKALDQDADFDVAAAFGGLLAAGVLAAPPADEDAS